MITYSIYKHYKDKKAREAREKHEREHDHPQQLLPSDLKAGRVPSASSPSGSDKFQSSPAPSQLPSQVVPPPYAGDGTGSHRPSAVGRAAQDPLGPPLQLQMQPPQTQQYQPLQRPAPDQGWNQQPMPLSGQQQSAPATSQQYASVPSVGQNQAMGQVLPGEWTVPPQQLTGEYPAGQTELGDDNLSRNRVAGGRW